MKHVLHLSARRWLHPRQKHWELRGTVRCSPRYPRASAAIVEPLGVGGVQSLTLLNESRTDPESERLKSSCSYAISQKPEVSLYSATHERENLHIWSLCNLFLIVEAPTWTDSSSWSCLRVIFYVHESLEHVFVLMIQLHDGTSLLKTWNNLKWADLTSRILKRHHRSRVHASISQVEERVFLPLLRR